MTIDFSEFYIVRFDACAPSLRAFARMCVCACVHACACVSMHASHVTCIYTMGKKDVAAGTVGKEVTLCLQKQTFAFSRRTIFRSDCLGIVRAGVTMTFLH